MDGLTLGDAVPQCLPGFRGGLALPVTEVKGPPASEMVGEGAELPAGPAVWGWGVGWGGGLAASSSDFRTKSERPGLSLAWDESRSSRPAGAWRQPCLPQSVRPGRAASGQREVRGGRCHGKIDWRSDQDAAASGEMAGREPVAPDGQQGSVHTEPLGSEPKTGVNDGGAARCLQRPQPLKERNVYVNTRTAWLLWLIGL